MMVIHACQKHISNRCIKFVFLCLFLIPSLRILPAQQKLSSEAVKEDSTIIYYFLYDTAGNTIFKINNDIGGPVMVWANYFDTAGHKTRTMTAHSNVGFSVWDYTYDSLNRLTHIFSFEEPAEQQGHLETYNTWIHVLQYKLRDDMENDPSIQWILGKNVKSLLFQYYYDAFGNKIRTERFNEKGELISTDSFVYKQIQDSSYLRFNGSSIYYYDTLGNKILTKRLVGDQDTIISSVMKYNTENQLIERIEYHDDHKYFVEKYEYENGLLKRETIKRNNKKLIFEKQYIYDAFGQLMQTEENNYELKRHNLQNYFYTYF
ncbi:MAG: hypothetical protein ACHQFW_10780 [Chitinophagales bacterium]